MSVQTVQPAAAPAPFQSASLYVGDLNNEATEVSSHVIFVVIIQILSIPL